MIEIYTKQGCPSCVKAKALLENNKVTFKNYQLDQDFSREYIVEKFPMARTYPIVVINGEFVGGYIELESKVNEDNTLLGKQYLTE